MVYTFYFLFSSFRILYGIKVFSFVSDPVVFTSSIVENWAKFIFKLMISVVLHFFISEFFYLWIDFNYKVNLFLESLLLLVFLAGYFKVMLTPELLYGSTNLKIINDYQELECSFLNDIWVFDLKKDLATKDVLIFDKINSKIFDYIKEIQKLAVNDCCFRRHDYSITNLASDTGLPKYFIEYIFKYHCKLSFNDYKKLVRIYDAVKLIDQGYLNINKLDALSKHVGFASYNPFLTKFKDIVGVSPFDYNNSRKFN
jgi:AraC-like DNA-binding protein